MTLMLWNTLTRVAIFPIFLPLLAKLGMNSETICTKTDVYLGGWEWKTESTIFQAQVSFLYTPRMRAISPQSNSLHTPATVGALCFPVGNPKGDLRNLTNMTGSSQSKIKDKEEQSKLSGHLLAENITTLILKKDKNIEQRFQSERNMEETRK